MNLPIFSDILIIGSIVGGSLVLVIGVAIVLHFTLFASLRYRSQVKELSRKFEYLHALLFGQDAQYLKRIEQIGTSNLLYSETYRTFSKRFKDVRDKSDSSAQAAVNGLKDLLQERDYKQLKLALPKAKTQIEAFDEEVNAFHADLLEVVKPEEECHAYCLRLKESLRRIKQDYYVKQADLGLVYDSFEKVFAKLDAKFADFDAYVDSAEYDDAKKLLPNLEKIIDQLGKILSELPNICVTIQNVIPDKMSSLEKAHDDLSRDGYPLHHLLVVTTLEDMRTELAYLTEQVQAFNLSGVQAQLDAMLSRIEDFFELFEKEKAARAEFLAQNDAVNTKAADADRKFIALCNALPGVRKTYIIAEDEAAKVDEIKNLINKAGATKRSLDTLVHSLTAQPYSILLEKMRCLKEESEAALDAIADFHRYLLSLKRDAEASLEAVKSYYARCKEAESILRAIELPSLDEKYLPQIDRAYILIDEIFSSLKAPIDVAKINGCVEELVGSCDAMLSNLQGDYEKQAKAQAAITYANRKRQSLGDVHAYLQQIEGLYFAGDFEKSYHDATELIRQLREQE